MPSTVGQISQYLVEAALGANPAVIATVANRMVACQISRGRADELGAMQPGTMTLVLDNGDGAFSPDNASGPYYGNLVPGRIVRVSARFMTTNTWRPLFYGYIDSIRPEDNGPVDSNVTIQCVDWLGKASNTIFSVGIPSTNGNNPQTWFTSLVLAIDPNAPSIVWTDGNAFYPDNLLAYSYGNASGLSAVQEFAATVSGVVFADATGNICMNAHAHTNGVAPNPNRSFFTTYFVFDQPGINPASGVVPYTAMDYDLTTQYLYNDVTVTASNTAEGPQTVDDSASQTAYGKRSLNLTFPYMGTKMALPMATSLMIRYRQPKPRIHALTLDIDAVTRVTANSGTVNAADELFALDLGNTVTVTKQAPGSLGLNRTMIIEGIKHDIKPDLGGHETTLQLSELTQTSTVAWQLGLSRIGIETNLAGSTAAFDPTTIPNCTLYLRSDIGVVTAGNNVTQWADQSGNNRNATSPAAAPIYVPSVLNGKAAVRFAVPAYMTFAINPFTAGPTWTAFAVYVSSGGGPLIQDYHWTGTASLPARGLNHHQAYDQDNTTFDGIATDPTTIVNGTPYIIAATCALAQPITVYVNGDAGTSASASNPITNYATELHTLGGQGNTGALNADLFAVVCYSRVLTTTEMATVRDGLNALYGVY